MKDLTIGVDCVSSGVTGGSGSYAGQPLDEGCRPAFVVQDVDADRSD